jgi:D-arabinose 1-dehydrogenase-like Zn-dependent alcohol dehydrogenase
VQPLLWEKEENSMKAMVRDTYSSADVLELREIDIPNFADDEVLVRVHAGIWKRDTPEEKSSSPCEANPKGLYLASS